MILKRSRLFAATANRTLLNSEVLQYHDMYALFNRNGQRGQIFSRCDKKQICFYLKTRTVSQKVKVFCLGKSLILDTLNLTIIISVCTDILHVAMVTKTKRI